jgi:hypothetical protein
VLPAGQPADLPYNNNDNLPPTTLEREPQPHRTRLKRKIWLTNPNKTLLVVPRRLDTRITRHRHILDNNTLPILTRNPHARLRRSHPTRDLKEVVVRPLCLFPCLPTIDRNFELGGPAVGIYYLCGEPVLRDAGFEVDGQRAGDERAAVDEFVGRVDYSFARVGFEGGPGVLEEVEVAGVALGTFVYNLFLQYTLSVHLPFVLSRRVWFLNTERTWIFFYFFFLLPSQ